MMRLAKLCDTDKKLIDGVTVATRTAVHLLFARLYRSMTEEARSEALAAFDAEAEAFKAGVKKVTRKVQKVLKPAA